MKNLWTFALTTALLSGSALAAFIQNPIPASTRENYLVDKNEDGRLDGISIKLLGNADQAYLDQMVDSLTFDWLDSSLSLIHVNVPRSNFKLESSRELFVDLSERQFGFGELTALHSKSVSGETLGNVKLFMSEGTVYNIAVKDLMVPVIKDAVLRSYRDERPDTLTLFFSESMKVFKGCESFLDYKSQRDGNVRLMPMSAVLWNDDATEAVAILNDNLLNHEAILPRDSVRLTQNCIGDSVGNVAQGLGKFVLVFGFYPLEIQSPSMVIDQQNINEKTPVFQLEFEKLDADVPNENEWGFSMDAMDEEFLSAVRNALGMPSKASLDLSKLKIHYNVRIYTNLGSFVVGTSADVKGSDSRFNGTAKKLFLKWNMMDGNRRHVNTGVYIANIIVQVIYDGKFVFRNDVHHGTTTQIFGVKRR